MNSQAAVEAKTYGRLLRLSPAAAAVAKCAANIRGGKEIVCAAYLIMR